MALPVSIYRAANRFYQLAFPLYRLAYSGFKAWDDRTERQVVRQILPLGGVVADVGANIGVYTRFFSSHVGSEGMVHAFEPAPENFRRLRAGAAHLANVRLNQLAVSDTTGESLLYISEHLNVDHRLYAPRDGPRRSMRINTIRLDDYFPPAARVDLLKLDIQGFELHALRGAERVLQENHQLKLLVEFWPYGLTQAGVKWSELIEMLYALDMQVMLVKSDGLAPFDARKVRADSSSYFNLFASRTALP